MGENDFFREKSIFLEGVNGWRFGAAKAGGGSGVGGAFSGLLHGWEKVRKFAGHSAWKVRVRKMAQVNTLKHIVDI